MRLLLLLTALLVLVPACATRDAGSGKGGAAPADGGAIAPADNDLRVDYDPADGTEPESWTLTCAGVVEGSHPAAEAACAHLKTLDHPFAPLAGDVVCTEQYGGPEKAHVLGRWNGEQVDLELSRTDGCRISQWDGLSPLVPVPVTPAPVDEAPPS